MLIILILLVSEVFFFCDNFLQFCILNKSMSLLSLLRPCYDVLTFVWMYYYNYY